MSERRLRKGPTELEAPTALVMKAVDEKTKVAVGTYEFGLPPLKPETIERKANGDTPLLETGEMRDSISPRSNSRLRR